MSRFDARSPPMTYGMSAAILKFSGAAFRQLVGFFVDHLQGLKARGNVEDWLGKVEEAMFVNLRKLVRNAITDYESKIREEWVLDHSSQVVSCGSLLI